MGRFLIWWCLLDKVRTYFLQNPDTDFWFVRPHLADTHPPATQNQQASKNY
jgi:hypothetical protein